MKLAVKRILTTFFALILVSGTMGCKKHDEEIPKILNVFIWSEYMPDSIFQKFEERTGIKVNRDFYGSNEEMVSKLQAGGAAYDIAVPTDYFIATLKAQNLLQKIDLNNIPNFKNLDPAVTHRTFDPYNEYTIPYMGGNGIIVYNKDKVKFPIESYNDLWKPELKNSLVVLDDVRALIGITLKSMGKSMSETDPAVLEEAGKKLKALMPNIKSFDSDSPKTMLIAGEAKAGYVWGAEAALAGQENKKIKAVIPKEGLWLWLDNFVIPAGARNKKGAELFINFILEPEISAEISREFPYANPNREARKLLTEDMRKNIAIYPPDEEMKRGEFLNDVGEAITIYDRIWSSVKQ